VTLGYAGGGTDQHQADIEWLYNGTPQSKVAVSDDMVWLYGANAKVSPRVAQPRPATAPSQPTPPAAPPPRDDDTEALPAINIPVKRVLVILLVIIGLWAVFLVYSPVHAWNKIATVDDIPSGTRPPQEPGTAILLVGTDSRQGLTAAQRKALGTGFAEGSRTDTMLIYYVPPKGSPVLISLPRDSYLPIPGHKNDKLNAAYSYGGPSLLVQTVEDATGLRMDGYLEIGFSGFVSLVDLVGGVEVCLKQPMVDQNSNINLPKGCQTLDGTKALGYVRQRYQDPRGDLGRVERQREIIGKVIAKLARPSTILNPIQYWQVCHTFARIVNRGQDTSTDVMTSVAFSAFTYAKGNVISLTVPISDPDARTAAGSSVLWDQNKAQTLFEMLAKGDTSQLDQFR